MNEPIETPEEREHRHQLNLAQRAKLSDEDKVQLETWLETIRAITDDSTTPEEKREVAHNFLNDVVKPSNYSGLVKGSLLNSNEFIDLLTVLGQLLK